MKYFTIDAENNITLHANRQAARDTGAAIFTSEVQFADLIGNDNQRLVEIWNAIPGVKAISKFANRKIATERIFRAIQTLGGPAAQEPDVATEAFPVQEPAPAPEAAALPDARPEIDAMQVPPAAIEASAPQAASEPEAKQPEAATQPETQQDTEALAAEQQLDSEPAPRQGQEASPAPAEPEAEPSTPFDVPVADVSVPAPAVAPTEPTPTKKATRAKKTPTNAPKAKATRESSKTDQAIAMMKRPGGATLPELMATFGWQAHTVRGFVAGALYKKLGLVVASTKPEGGERTYSIAS